MATDTRGVRLSLDLDDPQGIPYFLWDEPMTLSELRALPPEWDFLDNSGALAVSPDGRCAVVTRERIVESDLMLVEGFS